MMTMQTTRNLFNVRNQERNLIFWLFILIHIPLALWINQSRNVSTVYAMATLIVGLFIALTTRNAIRVAYLAAYIAGAEVLWRMTEARVFWEFGKYAIVAILLVYLLRTRQFKGAGLPILYFTLLTISIPLTLYDLSLDTARQAISFNLSGPLCLAVSVIFFSQFVMGWQERAKLMLLTTAPTIGIGAISLWSTVTARQIRFTDESNFMTSGGFGPNQVSAILGLGALLLLLLAIQQSTMARRWVPLGVSLGLFTLCVLTFSRGGAYNLAASLLVLAVFSLRNARLRNALLPILIIGIFAGSYLIYPKLEKFTAGAVTTRFVDTSTTGRIEIMQADLKVWQQHLLFGVGPGMSSYAMLLMLGKAYGAHTEYTRILAEHGILGLLSILFLLIMALKALRRAPLGLPQAWVAAILAWPFMEMTHAAMRVAAIGFLFGLAMAIWKPPVTIDSENKRNGSNQKNSSHRKSLPQ